MKKIYRILPYSIYDRLPIERWLEEQANAGLFPVSLDTWTAFSPTGIPKTRFRLVRSNGKEEPLSEEQQALFENAGWHRAHSVSNRYSVFYTTDPNAAEISCDEESERSSLERLQSQMVSSRHRIWLVTAVLLLFLIWLLFFHQSPYDVQPAPFARLPLLLLNLTHPVILLFFVYVFLRWSAFRRNEQTVRALHDALTQGSTPANTASKAIVRDTILRSLLLPLVSIFLIFHYFDFLNPWVEIPLERFSEPYISIQSLEQEEVRPWDEETFQNAHRNYADKNFSLLAPVWYEVSQKAYSPKNGAEPHSFSPHPEQEDVCYAPELTGIYCRVLFPALSRSVAESQLDFLRLLNIEWHYTESSAPDLDFVIHATEPDGVWQMLAIGKGRHIAVFRYAGREDLSAQLPVLSKVIQ